MFKLNLEKKQEKAETPGRPLPRVPQFLRDLAARGDVVADDIAVEARRRAQKKGLKS